MTTPGKPKQPNSTAEVAVLFGGLVLLLAGCGVVDLALQLGTTQQVSWFPPIAVLQLATGKVAWSTGATVALVLMLAVLLAIAVGVAVMLRRRRRGRSRVDTIASKLGHGDAVSSLTAKAATAKAKSLHVVADAGPGIALGRMVHGRGERLYASWEDTQVDIWGPRTGKSTSRVIPAIMDAPGAVIATSNKRDLVDATRDPRAKLGSKPWVFDPQNMVGEAPTWWWNPLSYVIDDISAIKLADLFAAGSADPGAKTDAFFDPEGKDVLAATLLAAALDGRPVTQVYSWVTKPSMEAVIVLRRNGYDLMGDALAAHISSPDKQKAGVFGTAKKMAGCLRLRGFQPWVTATGGYRPHLDVKEFVTSGDTLHLLSKEGAGTGGPLVAGLTVAIIEEAERQGARSRGGRLATPLLAALDEAANIVRWPELPGLYSHFGSRGIMLMTMLQSWSQGVECWGEAGMKKLWSSANINVYGGGVSELEFLRMLSELVGDYDYIGSSTSSGSGNNSGSVSRQAASGRILTAAHLNEWPRGRALTFSSGNRATLIKPEPWMAGPHAKAIEASIKANDPAAEKTLVDLSRGLTAVPLQSTIDTLEVRAS